MKRVVLHVDRLLLRGVAPGDAAALAGGLQAELQRLLGQPGGTEALAAHDGAAVLQARAARVAAGTGAGAIGRLLASRVVRGGHGDRR